MPNVEKPKDSLGSFIFKLIIVAIILIIGLIVLFTFVLKNFDPLNFVFNVLGLILMLGLLALAIKGLLSMIKEKLFSPTTDFRKSHVQISQKTKPFNVYDLYLRGEDMRTHAKLGKIKGIGFLPYVTSKVKKSDDGKPVFEKDALNHIVYEEVWNHQEMKSIKVPKMVYEPITEKDGDTLFIIPKHNFPLNLILRDLYLFRCSPEFHSDLVGDVYIKDVNFAPYGEYYYPAKQWKRDIVQIMKQNEAEAITQTHRNNLDLVSTTTQMSLGADPTYQKILLWQSERLSSGFGNPSGGNQ